MRTLLPWIVVMETGVSWLNAHTDSAGLDLGEFIRPYGRLLHARSIHR